MVKFWIIVGSVWLLGYGLVVIGLMSMLSLPLPVALMAGAGLGAGLWWGWSREQPAKELKMRDSTWYTPEEEER